jgi:hypothetical protein
MLRSFISLDRHKLPTISLTLALLKGDEQAHSDWERSVYPANREA